jgi:transcriptional repressor NrdR
MVPSIPRTVYSGGTRLRTRDLRNADRGAGSVGSRVSRSPLHSGCQNRMRCPFCREDNDRVIDSRVADDGFSIRRRRHCLTCGRRYTTYERPDEMAIKVVKKDGCREPFRREKIRQGLERACWKRPISAEQIDRVVSDIESDVHADFESEIDSQTLGELVMEHLRDLDQVAFVRFASVYREFKDVSDFVHELQPILRDRAARPRES